MKKFFSILFCLAASIGVYAQSNTSNVEVTNSKDATARWYMQGLVGVNNTGTETMSIGDFGGNIGFMGNVQLGYEFNPYIGLGVQLQYACTHTKWDDESYGFDALIPSIVLEWNINNTLLGYKAERKNNFRLYAGIAGAYTGQLFTGYEKGDFTDNYYALGFRAGLQYEHMLKNDWAFVADAGINSFNDKFEHRKLGGLDSHVGLQVGFRKYVGRSKKHRNDFKETIVNYIERRDTTVITKIEEIRKPKEMYSIFFVIDKIDIRESEMVKIKAVADFMKAHPEKVVFVFGYADKNTGTKRRNAWLAENRARVICEQLTNTFGIDPSRIISYHQGDKVQPFTEEEFEKNRATICVITDFVR